MSNGMISVIVPVYNVESYVERCVKTLVNQAYSNYEILLIDDGSTDSSGSICDLLASIDERIKVYHKENGGLGSARNYGIKHANGEFICFVDSDDIVSSNYLSELINGMVSTNADIVICGYIYQTGKRKYLYNNERKTIDIEEALAEMSKGNPMFNFAWNKLYKMSIISRMEKLFEDRHCAEDMYFNCYYYRLINKVCIIPDELYTYFVNPSSLSNGRRKNFYQDMKLVYKAFGDTCKEKKLKNEYAGALLIVLLRNSISNYFNARSINYSDYIKFITELYDDSYSTISKIKFEISSVDKIFYKLFIKKQFFLVYIIMKCMKYMKGNFSYVFSCIRKSLS